MEIQYSNPCIRCGKKRINSKTWKEKIINFMGTSVITHTETVCPDPECQAIVEKELSRQREKREVLKQERENRVRLSRVKRSE